MRLLTTLVLLNLLAVSALLAHAYAPPLPRECQIVCHYDDTWVTRILSCDDFWEIELTTELPGGVTCSYTEVERADTWWSAY